MAAAILVYGRDDSDAGFVPTLHLRQHLDRMLGDNQRGVAARVLAAARRAGAQTIVLIFSGMGLRRV